MNVGGRCYELAMEYVLSHEDCFLIHGQAYGRAHAWIETADGKTWDPTDRIHDEHAVEEKRYTRRQAGQLALSTGKYGFPWTERQAKSAYEMTSDQATVERAIAALQKIAPRGPTAESAARVRKGLR